MRSVQVARTEGPTGVEVVEAAEPARGDQEVLVEVQALGVSWPDLLLTRGECQLKPEVTFQLGVDFAGVVREAPEGSGFAAGDRVACCLPYGGGADLVAVHPESVFPVPDAVGMEKAAALPMNYLTAQFAGRLRVVGFTAGRIPEVRLNRLLLNNIDVRGVGWGAFAMVRPGFMRSQWDELVPMMQSGVLDPPVPTTYPVEDVARALADLAERKVLGKTVLTFG